MDTLLVWFLILFLTIAAAFLLLSARAERQAHQAEQRRVQRLQAQTQQVSHVTEPSPSPRASQPGPSQPDVTGASSDQTPRTM